MKKQIIIVILFGSIVGYLFGNILFKNYQGIDYLDDDGNIYYLQYGVYTTKDSANSNTKDLDIPYVIHEMDEKYYVYLGITSNYDIALKLRDMYKEKNIHIYIRSDYVENSETLDKLKEYDLELENIDNVETVMKEIFENSDLNL